MGKKRKWHSLLPLYATPNSQAAMPKKQKRGGSFQVLVKLLKREGSELVQKIGSGRKGLQAFPLQSY